jgi:hypothetical protein
MSVLMVWSMFMATCIARKINLVHPAAWLVPSLLQLVHVVQRVAASHASPAAVGALRTDAVIVSAKAFTLSAHSTLYKAVTGQPGDVALGATAAEALRQVRARAQCDDPAAAGFG